MGNKRQLQDRPSAPDPSPGLWTDTKYMRMNPEDVLSLPESDHLAMNRASPKVMTQDITGRVGTNAAHSSNTASCWRTGAGDFSAWSLSSTAAEALGLLNSPAGTGLPSGSSKHHSEP